MKRRLTCLLLALILLLGMLPSVCAASDEAQTAADALHTLGLFNGTCSSFITLVTAEMLGARPRATRP